MRADVHGPRPVRHHHPEPLRPGSHAGPRTDELVERDLEVVGASAAVYGVMLAYARRWPETELLLFFAIPVKIKYLNTR